MIDKGKYFITPLTTYTAAIQSFYSTGYLIRFCHLLAMSCRHNIKHGNSQEYLTENKRIYLNGYYL